MGNSNGVFSSWKNKLRVAKKEGNCPWNVDSSCGKADGFFVGKLLVWSYLFPDDEVIYTEYIRVTPKDHNQEKNANMYHFKK